MLSAAQVSQPCEQSIGREQATEKTQWLDFLANLFRYNLSADGMNWEDTKCLKWTQINNMYLVDTTQLPSITQMYRLQRRGINIKQFKFLWILINIF